METLPAPHPQTLPLSGGRKIGYTEYGDPHGKPFFYFHGWPSSRIEFGGLNGHTMARSLGLRVIAADRPGFGLSEVQAHHHFNDWPRDVACLADALGIARFGVISYSAGSPYALSCARHLANRLNAVGIVSGLAQPLSAPGATEGMPTLMLWRTARIHPRLTWLLFKLMKGSLAKAPRDQAPANARQAMMGEADFAYVKKHPAILGGNLDGGLEALRQGGWGPAQAAAQYWKDWGFRLEEIATRVHVWHGEADLNAPFAAHGQVLAQRLPRVQARFYPGEGHISLVHKHLKDILQCLADS